MLSVSLALAALFVVTPGGGGTPPPVNNLPPIKQEPLRGLDGWTKTQLTSCQVVIQGRYHQVINVYATVPNTNPEQRFVFVIVDGDFRGTQSVKRKDWPCHEQKQ